MKNKLILLSVVFVLLFASRLFAADAPFASLKSYPDSARKAKKEAKKIVQTMPDGDNEFQKQFLADSLESVRAKNKKELQKLPDGDNDFQKEFIQDSINTAMANTEVPVVNTSKDGKKVSEGNMIGKAKYGFWKFYDSDGKLRRTASYKKDVLDGEYVEYFSDGKKKSCLITYAMGKKNGPMTCWYQNGRVQRSASMKNDKMEGEVIHYSEDGREKYLDRYENGKMVFTSFYLNGVLKSKETISSGE